MADKKTIWCLFMVPEVDGYIVRNLVRWWSQKPTIRELGSYMAMPIHLADDAGVLRVVRLWDGQVQTFFSTEQPYQFLEVPEGTSM